MSLKDRDKNQVNVTNGLKTIRCVKTERREETEEMIVAGEDIGGKGKRWGEGSMDSMMRFKLYFKRRTRPWRISSREHRVAARRSFER